MDGSTPAGGKWDKAWLYALLLAGSSLAIYVYTLCPTVYWRDSAEYAWVGPSGGILHSSGYPIYSILIRLLAKLPLHEVAWRVNLASSLSGTLALLVFFFLLKKLKVNMFVAFAVALHLGFTREFWAYSTTAEVYSLHALFTVSALYVAILAVQSPIGENKYIWLLALVCGLSFSNHLTTFLWAPGLAVLIWPKIKELFLARSIPGIGLALLAFSAGFLPYAYLLITALGPNPFNQGDPSNLSRLVAHMLGTQAWGRSFLFDHATIFRHISTDAVDLWIRGTPLGLLAGIFGFIVMWKKGRKRLTLGLLVLITSVLSFASMYETSDRAWCLIPVDIALALAAAFFLQEMVQKFSWKYSHSPVFSIVAMGLVFLFPLTTLGWRMAAGEAGTPGRCSLRDYTEAVLREAPVNSMIMVRDLNVYHGIRYVQRFLDVRKDVIPIAEYLIPYPWYMRQIKQDHPELAGLDDALKTALGGARELARMDPLGRGGIYLDLIEGIEKVLIRDNLDDRAVLFLPYNDREVPKEHYGFPLVWQGLTYRVNLSARKPQASTSLAQLPGPDKCFAPELVDEHARLVARRFAAAFNFRGVLRAKAGDFARAEEDLKESLKYDPGFKNPYLNLALLFSRTGRKNNASNILNLCMDIKACTEEEIKKIIDEQGL
ncbi:MAG: DUF2723 domain-containing protein [Deltaproteobacteria bacterium]|nr:DUF2723 domain-containing protein [Deltaproteobacteria bacterium]